MVAELKAALDNPGAHGDTHSLQPGSHCRIQVTYPAALLSMDSCVIFETGRWSNFPDFGNRLSVILVRNAG